MEPAAPRHESAMAERPGRRRGWMLDIIAGVAAGGITGAILAVNLVIVAGPDQGYETTIPEVFDHNVLLGVATVTLLAAGPVVGIITARRVRRGRDRAAD